MTAFTLLFSIILCCHFISSGHVCTANKSISQEVDAPKVITKSRTVLTPLAPNTTSNPEELGNHEEGDILNWADDDAHTDRAAASLSKPDPKWPNATVPYTIERLFDTREVALILGAMAEISETTCLKFYPKSSQDLDYVAIVDRRPGCSSFLGRQGGEQELNLGRSAGCLDHGRIVHQLMHTLGFGHELSRHDRDDYISLIDSNIEGGGQNPNFKKRAELTPIEKIFAYDYYSVMQAPLEFFSKNNKSLSFIQKHGSFNGRLGQRVGLSLTDSAKIRHMYKKENCPCGGYRCEKSDQCLSSGKKCDGIEQCLDQSDEKNCSTCAQTAFQCADDGRCIRISYRCNGVGNCRDRSDEDNCTTCAGGGFLCSNGKCIEGERRCNGNDNCGDNSDEKNCDDPKLSCPSPEKFHCKNNKCLAIAWRCNGWDDCGDNSDELNCTPCPPDRWQCDEKCIWTAHRCDGHKDCADGSDEVNCTSSSCPETYFHCSRSGKCIWPIAVCNGRPDCGSYVGAEVDYEDEENCPKNCPAESFECVKGRNCIPLSWRCGVFSNCQDLTDQMNCTYCNNNGFLCDNGNCVNDPEKCDWVPSGVPLLPGGKRWKIVVPKEQEDAE